ncbi:DUF262 domain-containing protein [Wohlfahrtiimonas chitiniclastica]|uniref:DUF262 domain-containing protein n=1 Tax=Wohlfahrtiimonas chitiniclastica TaxID=400946 RepID=UPI000B98EB32|nr:DUF262 domain-containing protein [Wohlfahrtiimonas chitiniclastica]MBS7836293.1 DUF262 domain-containing protein [Wohlfahrtiimonas chitiniclastica]OYQ89690.1 hypothetical protein B9T21_02770 [Wohlfahrtiimonas chitiniclastica]
MGNNDIKGYSLHELFGKQSDHSNDSYLIPIYQRNYAWGEGEIKQLIDDVADYAKKAKDKEQNFAKETPKYYIGTLMVHQREDGKYEVIDGQQRLTTLFLMLCYCQKSLPNFSLDAQKLIFENRPKSTKALQKIVEYTQRGNTAQPLVLSSDENNQAIIAGFNLIKELITEQKLSQTSSKLTVEEFFNYLLNHVVIYRVRLPKNTDLNHYFEVMNNRGEQLEKHEIIKARLLAEMEKSESDLTVLASVWDAVANMNQYVQYGFSTDLRSAIFGTHWDDFKPANYNELKTIIGEKEQTVGSNSKDQINSSINLTDILANPTNYLPKENKHGSKDTTEPPERFYSVIQFPAFLLHVLKIFSVQNKRQDDKGKLIDVAIDDKQLIPAFEECLLNSNLAEDERLARIKEFTHLLLKMKFLFDHYVIKREYKENGEEWSLQALYYSAEKNSSGYYRQTFQESEFGGINNQILMLQSAFHVSVPTQNYKYWLLGALNILIDTCRYEATSLVVDAKAYLNRLEDQAERFMFDRYLAEKMQAYEAMIFSDDTYIVQVRSIELLQSTSMTNLLTYGQIRNNFVFNYLDYRLWRSVIVEEDKLDLNEDKAIYDNFVFTFRSSIEHFYPQNPTESMNKKPADEFPLHSFGNLCLLGASKNSQLGNDLPSYKHKHFETALKMKKIDSLKLYKMIQKLKENDDWLMGDSELHEREMLEILFSPFKNKKEDCHE